MIMKMYEEVDETEFLKDEEGDQINIKEISPW